MKIAFIGGYGTKCGVATYNENLIKAIREFSDIHVFAERNNLLKDNKFISYCWSVSENSKLDLIKKIKEYNPDVLLFSHEFGYYPKSYLWTNLMSYFKWKKYKIFSIFHSVYENHLDKTVNYASCPNILVHSEGARSCLIDQGICYDKINVIPHGMSLLSEDRKLLENLWDTWGCPTIFSMGFGFYYKGGLDALEIVANLKEKYPNIQYISQFSENPKCQEEHDKLYDEMMLKAESLDIIHNITINRGFADLKVLLSFIRSCKVCLLPYRYNPEHNVYAASGAARIIMSTETPLVIRGNVNLFNDIKEFCLYSDTNEGLADKISEIFEGKYNIFSYNQKRLEFIKKHEWSNVAKNLFNIMFK